MTEVTDGLTLEKWTYMRWSRNASRLSACLASVEHLARCITPSNISVVTYFLDDFDTAILHFKTPLPTVKARGKYFG